MATGTVAASRPRVAVCFTGFVRNHTSLARDVDRILGDATYHAFVVAPLQHFELDAYATQGSNPGLADPTQAAVRRRYGMPHRAPNPE